MLKPKMETKISGAVGFLKYSSMAFQMIGAILVCVFLGRYLDKHFPIFNHIKKEDLKAVRSFPLFTFLGTLLGVISSLYLAIKSLKK